VAEKFASVDDYLRSLTDEQRGVAEQVRRTIHESLPGAGEKISYNMPAVTVDGRVLVYFAAWKTFLSLYPAPRGDDDFEEAVAPYRGAKDALQFPYAKPVPHELIARVVSLMREQRLS